AGAALVWAACGGDDGGGDVILYDKPQIVPDNNPVCVNYRTIEAGEEWRQPILVQNLGRETLEITSSTIASDTRGSFTMRGPDTPSVASTEFAHYELVYKPETPGWDAVALQIESNAENYPRLDVYVIARAVPPGLDGGTWDAGPRPPQAGPTLCNPDGGL
ncbi:hypothetical protein L6R52_37405, partial [Myxococcota bacterium]|nr:hypothetical protein [Myxococcota bacterium]